MLLSQTHRGQAFWTQVEDGAVRGGRGGRVRTETGQTLPQDGNSGTGIPGDMVQPVLDAVVSPMKQPEESFQALGKKKTFLVTMAEEKP